MQAERVRRWVASRGYRLLAVCQDMMPGDPTAAREGLRAMLVMVRSRQADLVVVPTLEALSADKVVQEIILHQLRSTGVAVASTEEADVDALSAQPSDPARRFIRTVLDRAVAVGSWLDDPAGMAPVSTRPEPAPDVIVELVDEHTFRRLRQATA